MREQQGRFNEELGVKGAIRCLPEIKSRAGASRTYGYPNPEGQTNQRS